MLGDEFDGKVKKNMIVGLRMLTHPSLGPQRKALSYLLYQSVGGGSLSKSSTKSLLIRMGMVKREGTALKNILDVAYTIIRNQNFSNESTQKSKRTRPREI